MFQDQDFIWSTVMMDDERYINWKGFIRKRLWSNRGTILAFAWTEKKHEKLSGEPVS
jgi:hypothetical protein